MNDNTTTPTVPTVSSAFHRPAALIGGGLGLAAIGALATALVLGGPGSQDAQDSPYMTATEPAVQAAKGRDGEAAERAGKTRQVAEAGPKKAAAPVCASCGVVEAVTPVQHKGEGTGLGAVAGGVLGAVVGHQVGGGNGKKAMTVIGAVGGGVAGNEIEKRQRATTVYQLKIRMADGTLRSVTQSQQFAVGQQVKLEGETVRPA
ncbi:MAG: glycine zipper 2TM domain-containing protein [Rubrivivax sp.]